MLPPVERDRVFAAMFLIALSPLFWALSNKPARR
jgi:dipeptide/tripeptide permease